MFTRYTLKVCVPTSWKLVERSALVLILCLVINNVFGQEINYDLIELFSQKNGLSSNVITSIVQDKQGYLWIATDDGLNRYDGYSFKVYKQIADDSTSMPFSSAWCLEIDPKGNVWFASREGNIGYYHPPTQKFINLKGGQKGLPSELIVKIFFDRSGKMWVCPKSSGLYFFDQAKQKFIHAGNLSDIHPDYPRELPYNSIYDIYEDAYGLFWLATHDGLYLFDPLKLKFRAVREKPVVPFEHRNDCFGRILPGADGLWLSSWAGGLTFYNFKNQKWKNFKYDLQNPEKSTTNIVEDLAWKSKEELWICTADRGWGMFNINDERFFFPNFPLGKNIRCSDILEDRSGVLWFTSGSGLFKYVPHYRAPIHKKITVKRSDNGEFFGTSGFYHDLTNKILYYGTTFGDGLHARDLTTGQEKVFEFEANPFEKALIVSQLLKDSHDTLWVLTSSYIYTFDKKTDRLIKFWQPPNTSSRSHFFRNIFRSKNGDLWIGTYRTGLFRYDIKLKKFIHYVHDSNDPASLCNNVVSGLEEDNYGRIWIATNKGLSIFNYQTGEFQNYYKEENNRSSLTSNTLTGITKTPSGDLWISTASNGLYQFENSPRTISFKKWRTDEGLPSNIIHSITTDAMGAVWIVTPSNLVSIDTGLQVKSYSLYSEAFQIYADSINTLYIGSYGGFIQFNPYEIKTNPASPALAINSFKIFDNEVPLWLDSSNTAMVTLDYDQNFISFEFTAFDFRNPLNNQFAYTMVNVDEEWIYSRGRRYANYTNLQPGEYTFRVKAANPEGVWTEPGISVKVIIKPPVWGTWYFRILAVLLLTAIFIYLYKARVRKIRKEEKIKLGFNKRLAEIEMSALRAQMNPHFIFNSLNSVNRYIVKADPETASLYLTKFSRLIRLILDNSKNSKILLDQELNAITLYVEMELIRFDHKFSYNIDVKKNVDTQSIAIPPMIFQPYIENAIWHGLMPKPELGKLDIIFERDAETLICTIEDNGVGREQAMKFRNTALKKKSHGMQITSDRLSLLERESNLMSSVEVIDLRNDSNEATGTRVILKIPITKPDQIVVY